MNFAYADPPYLGQGRKYDHPLSREWDSLERHQALITQLVTEFPDGWAMSLSSPSMKHLLPLVPDDCRIAAWVKPFHAYKKGVRPAYSWEPIIYRGGRNPPAHKHAPPEKGGKATTPKDFHSANITLKKGLTGAKPLSFCGWILDLLNVHFDDTITDLFPGTRIMGEAAELRCTYLATE